MNKKETGSFYTPESLIKYMVSYIENRLNLYSILEPSAGDGRFVKHLERLNSNITLIELDMGKVEHLRNNYDKQYDIICDDFIHHSLNSTQKYDLIIGNPPYISKKNIPSSQYDDALKIVEHYKIERGVLQNLWVAFVLASIKMLSDNGTIFFVLPFEFLQVQYAEKLRAFLESRFNTIEIITFEERIFDDIEQDICLLYLSNEPKEKPYIKYSTYISAENRIKTFESVIMRNKPLKKWSNCILNDEETEKLSELAKLYPKVSTFGEISPGIVTGANSFFILSEQSVKKLSVPEQHVLPILTKSAIIPSLFSFKMVDFKELCGEKNRTHMLNLSNLEINDFSEELKKYITTGKMKKINAGYKCSHRKRWYDVPLVKSGDVCFFKRYHKLPRIIVNEAQIHTTDITYNVRFNSGYDPASFAFCFYNSLTLALCEYNGRFYGGGVGELVPTEFKNLTIPYKKIRRQCIDKIERLFRANVDIQLIIDYVDSIVLKQLSVQDIEMLQKIRKRYLSRRLRNK